MSRPASVRALVLAARRRWLAARWTESALAGGAVAGLTLAAATLSGAAPGSPGAILAALLCAVLAGLTLAAERRQTPRAFAQRLDQRIDAGGGLATAFECEGRAAPGTIAGLHVARTLARLDRRLLFASVAPPSAALVAALVLGAALAALALERGPPVPVMGGEAARAGAALARVAALAREPGPAPGSELEAALLAAELEGPGNAPAEERAEAAQALESLLARGDLALPTQGQVRSFVERLRSAPVGGSGPAPGAGTAPAAAGSPAPALAAAAPDRTMSGLYREPPVPPTPLTSVAAERGPSFAAPAGRWWPRRHDAVVVGYLQRTRAALGAREDGGR